MEVTVHSSSVWDGVVEMTKLAQERESDPLMWAAQLSSDLLSVGVSMPSPEVADILVSHICWGNNVPITWKLLEKALSLRIVPPLLVLALLSTKVIPNRRSHPAAYRLYLELLKRYTFSLASEINGPNYQKTMEYISNVLHLSKTFDLQSSEPGLLLVEFVFSIAWQLVDVSLDDENLLELTAEKKSKWPTKLQDLDFDDNSSFGQKKIEFHERLLKINTVMAIESAAEFFRNKVTSRILYLARRNMPVHWGSFILHLRLLATKSTALRSSKTTTTEALLQLTSDARILLTRQCKTNSQQRLHAIMASGSLISSAGQSQGASRSAVWLPIDVFLEDTMDGTQAAVTSAAETLTGLVKALRAVNQTSWQEAFLGLWTAGLRLVQRERDTCEGPVPRLDTCLCLLLCVAPLAIVDILDEEENVTTNDSIRALTRQKIEKWIPGQCRKDLVESLKQLGEYEGLLTPPGSVTSIANQAAAKAILFLSGVNVGNGYLDGVSLNDMPVNCSGNLQHLIVEACIARNLLDTSAYLWPGYVKGRSSQIPHTISGQVPSWSSLIKGSPLTPPLINALVSIPASSLAEIEKIYEIAANGSDDEKISSATVLCGASLTRGWNIQEHTVIFITRLLSPPVPSDCSGSESHLLHHAPFLNVLLVGISSFDCVKIFSLHGVVPQLAGALMPLCEVFGSCAPKISWTLSTGEEISTHAVFSNAFTLLLKLWRFHSPPLEQVMADVTPVGSTLTPEFLLLVRNSQLPNAHNQSKSKGLLRLSSLSSSEPIFMDSFPKLKLWYRQHQACIASTLSDLVPGTPAYQTFDGLLNMMFRKVSRGAPATSGSSNSSGSGTIEDSSLQLNLPAWDILEAVPFVLDGALTACSHGILSPRELITGLKDLADFLPASMATIVSYFSAEVTRGIWKPAFMNGCDWPSPAANLSMVEQNIKKILAETGVDVPSLAVAGTFPVTLPLPLAALVSLTITYKIDRGSERLLNLAAPALNSLAAGCPWPCMPVIAALWAQKAKRWKDFFIFSASRTVFHHNTDAVVQLLRVCFTSTLGLNSSPITCNGGVGALLGHGFGSHCFGGISPVAPGILYLRVHRCVRNVIFMTEEILSLLMQSVKDITTSELEMENLDKLKKNSKHGMLKYGRVSLAAAMTRVKLAASLGASLVWITGGLNLVQCLIKEALPSWFISIHKSSDIPNKVEYEGVVGMLKGYALAYFAMFSGTFAWGVDSSSPESKKRQHILGVHLEFMASALGGKISLGCNSAIWRAYVSGFVSLMVVSAPEWILDVEVEIVRSLSKGLKQWDEEELALALLGLAGVGAMGAAAEMIIESLV